MSMATPAKRQSTRRRAAPHPGEVAVALLFKYDVLTDEGPALFRAATRVRNATDRQLRAARRVIDAIEEAVVCDNKDSWKSLDALANELDGRATVTERRRGVLRAIERARGLSKRPSKAREGADPTEELASRLIDALSFYDDRFVTLNRRKVAQLIKSVRPASQVVTGGAGNIKPHLAAARLSVMVHAFDDRTEKLSKQAFLKALPPKQLARR